MKLSNLQKRVYDTLALDEDVKIADMHKAAYPASHTSDTEVRVMQQRLGSVIARINEKLTKTRIVPGRVKQTYRLETVKRKK